MKFVTQYPEEEYDPSRYIGYEDLNDIEVPSLHLPDDYQEPLTADADDSMIDAVTNIHDAAQVCILLGMPFPAMCMAVLCSLLWHACTVRTADVNIIADAHGWPADHASRLIR